MNIDINNLVTQISRDKKKLLLSLITAIVFIYADVRFVLQPQLGNMSGMYAKKTNIKGNIGKFNRDMVNILELKRKQDTAAKQTNTKVKKFISEKDVPELLKEISDIANKNQVRVMQIKPVKLPVEKKTAVPEKFLNMNIALDLSADYHHFGSFLNELENMNIFLATQDLRIAGNPRDYFHQNINLQLKTYVKE